MRYRQGSPVRSARRASPMPRLMIAIIIAVISLVSYFGAQVYNPVTGETQHIDMTVEQEIALGLQAAPEMAQQYGGLDPNDQAQALVGEVGNRLVAQTAANETPYQFKFYLLDDPQTVNAFALPGGPSLLPKGY
jgi:predicted Zn-dependent protease